MGAEGAATKALIGGGLGALGGALAQDPKDLTSFIGQKGLSGIPYQGQSQARTVDPGDLLARGVGLAALGFEAAADRLAQPFEFGPQATVQSPAYAFGGALPGTFGTTVSDPGYLPAQGIDIGLTGFGPGGTTDPEDVTRRRRPFGHGGADPAGAGAGAGAGAAGLAGAASRGGLPLTGSAIGAGLGFPQATAGGFDNFLNAMNLLALGQKRSPVVPGGFNA